MEVRLGLYDRKHPNISTFNFAPDKETQRVRGIEERMVRYRDLYSSRCTTMPFHFHGLVRYGMDVPLMNGESCKQLDEDRGN